MLSLDCELNAESAIWQAACQCVFRALQDDLSFWYLLPAKRFERLFLAESAADQAWCMASVEASNAFRRLLEAGVNQHRLRFACATFRRLACALERSRDELRRRKLSITHNGRPHDLLTPFQLICHALFRGDNDRRFYSEFHELARLIFGRAIEAESYQRLHRRSLEAERRRKYYQKPLWQLALRYSRPRLRKMLFDYWNYPIPNNIPNLH